MTPAVAAVLTFVVLCLLIIALIAATNPFKTQPVVNALAPVPPQFFTVYHVVMDDGTLTFMSLADRRDFLLNVDRACVLCDSQIGQTEHAMIARWASDATAQASAVAATTRRME